jgi:hypothetical protein
MPWAGMGMLTRLAASKAMLAVRKASWAQRF